MMNQSFNKALYLLDLGDYERGEEELKKAIQTNTDPYETAGIKTCYARLLYEEERYKESMVYVEEVLNLGDAYLFSEERDRVLEIKEKILGEQSGKPEESGQSDGSDKPERSEQPDGSGNQGEDIRKTGMKYWRVRTEKEENIHYRGMDEENEMKLCPYFFNGKGYIDSWDSSLTICIDERKDNIAYSDVPRFDTTCFLVNEKMLNILYQYAEGAFEILDINCMDGNYVLVNIIEKLDCIDMEKSIYKVWKGAPDEIRTYEKLYLLKDKINGRNLFRAEHTTESFFLCSDEMKRAIEEQGIVGLNFEFVD